MFDVLVLGLGAMGSSALHHLASRGAHVVGVDRHQPPHALGSTHGRSRIIREAYYEHPGYVPLVRRAYENWAALEKRSGLRLFEQTGGLMMGSPECGLVRGASDSARQHGIDVDMLSAVEIEARYPALAPGPGMVGVFERRAGVLFPELCVGAHLRLALEDGAQVRTDTTVLRLEPSGECVTAVLAGDRITARHVVVAAGPWTSELLAPLGIGLPLVIERQTMHWLNTDRSDARFGPRQLPVTLIEHDGARIFYAIPDLGDGLKAAIHYEGVHVPIDEVDRTVASSDTDPVLGLTKRFLPRAPGRIRESAVCVYTNTPDLHFVFGTSPANTRVTIVSACSGHGFKFASAIGEVVAQGVLGESPSVDTSMFCMRE